MREFSLDDLDGDSEEEKRTCPFTLRRKETLSGRSSGSERSRRKGGDRDIATDSRESLGVYGAIMQVNWEHE
jgi:hypothetical protein